MHGPVAMAGGGAIRRRRILEHIELLCTCGAGVEAIASPLTEAVRDLLGAASGSIFWSDEAGQPAGFYHDCAPPELKDLFVTRFEELFDGPGQINMRTLTQIEGPSIGRMLDPAFTALFLGGNVYRYLCVPLDHHHLLDMRIEANGIGRAAYCAWNPRERPFTAADVEILIPAQALMERAFQTQDPHVTWESAGDGTAHLITDPAGERLVAISAEADAILCASQLLSQRVSLARPPEVVPGFVTLLAHMAAASGSATHHVPVADGRIVARASRSRAVGNDGELLFVTIDHQRPREVALIGRLMALDLTPLQRRIALHAARGGERAACTEMFGVSREALKKHLRAIFDATGADHWRALARL